MNDHYNTWAQRMFSEHNIEYHRRFLPMPNACVVRMPYRENLATLGECLALLPKHLEYAMFLDAELVTVLGVTNETMQDVWWYEAFGLCYHWFEVEVKLRCESRLNGLLGHLWFLRDAERLYCTPSFEEILPITEWMESSLTPRWFIPKVELPRNIVTRTYKVQLNLAFGRRLCDRFVTLYCVDKVTGFDFWIVRDGNRALVINGGFLTQARFAALRLAVKRFKTPPEEDYAFITCVVRTDWDEETITSDLMPFCDPKWTKDPGQILSAMFFVGKVDTYLSSIRLVCPVSLSTYWDLARKIKAFGEKKTDCVMCGEAGLFPCYRTHCNVARCYRCCFGRGSRAYCQCGASLTGLWWELVNPERHPFATLDLSESISTLSLSKFHEVSGTSRYPDEILSSPMVDSFAGAHWDVLP